MSSFAEYESEAQSARVRVNVRAAVDADIETIDGIQLRAGRAAHSDAYRRAIHAAERCLLVAEKAVADESSVIVGWGQTHHHTVVTDPAPAGHYLGGVTVDPSWRRRGIAVALTQARIDWIADRASEVYYVVNLRNQASIELHRPWAFEEVTRAARLAGTSFDGGVGLLMRAAL